MSKEDRPPIDTVIAERVADRRKLDAGIVAAALRLLGSGHAAPYLARYRREEVGGLDEIDLREIEDEAATVREMEQRREFILRAVSVRGVPEKLERRIERCRNRSELEYLYEPYRPPRKTPGSLARERGFEPVAEALLKNEAPEDGSDDALAGAREILAERFAVDPQARGAMLRVIEKEGVITTTPPAGKSEIPQRFSQFQTYEEKFGRVPSHRFLALQRAEKEGAVASHVTFPEAKVLAAIEQRHYPKEPSETTKAFLDRAAHDAIRLMRPAVFDDAMRRAKDRADLEAIIVFRRNLSDLLLYPPAGPHRVMGVDPSPRGAIPIACVDERGQHLEHVRLRLFDRNEGKVSAAKENIVKLAQTHGVKMIALGNGQGRRQCENFLNECFAGVEDAPIVVVVNEAGVGAYASGAVGRAELPALSVPIRGAVSLARRLMDPLTELVKVDPRQIGVGQYQNDVDANRLGRSLGFVVESCVNYVGVDVNRAPVQQLARVCGVTTSAARSLVEHREKQGMFRSLAALAELPFITERTFEQAAGFLRVEGGENPIDATGVHPAHAPLVNKIAEKLGKQPGELVRNTDLLADLDVEELADEQFSPASVAGVLAELIGGGEDPRPRLEVAARSSEVRSAEELREGMRLSGRVTNVTNFGAFVDIGVQQDGLVHVSELADYFVKDPTTVVRVGEVVEVRVMGVDTTTGRISLSMKSGRPRPPRREKGPRPAPRGRPRPQAKERDTASREPDPMPPAPEVEPAAPVLNENPVPTDMTEEEFMKAKMDELRKRFS